MSEAATGVTRLEQQTVLAEKLAATRGTNEVREVLHDIVAYECGDTWDAEVDPILDALYEVVAFAMRMRADGGIEYGSKSTREAIAQRLGLGRLA